MKNMKEIKKMKEKNLEGRPLSQGMRSKNTHGMLPSLHITINNILDLEENIRRVPYTSSAYVISKDKAAEENV